MVTQLREYVFLFFVYSFLGWVMETIYMSIRSRHLTKRGFLRGPICPIYGIGLVAITLLLQHATEHFLGVFILIIVLCTTIEYVTSVILERVFHTRWWDYHDMRFNINGRICLETTIPFGIIGSVALYYINPLLMQLYGYLPLFWERFIIGVLCSVFVADVLVTVYALVRMKLPEGETDHTEEITHAVWEQLVRRFR